MKIYLVVIAGILGLMAGLVAADEAQQSYCKDIEQQVIDRDRLNGTLACFDPATTDMDIGEDAQAELKCTCVISANGNLQFINVGTS